MPTPTMITVTGTVNPLLQATSVQFYLPKTLRHDASNSVYVPSTIEAAVALDGTFTADVPAGNDPDWAPLNVSTQISVIGPNLFDVFYALIPYNDQTLDFSTLVPSDPSDGTLYATYNHTHDNSAALNLKLDKVGGTITGDLTVAGKLDVGGSLVFRSYLDISGAPTSGTWVSGDVVFTRTGVYRCSVGGTPGTWLRLSEDENNFGPQDHGVIHGWTQDPTNIQGTLQWSTAGIGRVFRVRPTKNVISAIWFHFTGGGSALTAGQCFAAIYNSAGAKIGADAVTVDQAANWSSGGAKRCQLVTPQGVTPYDDYQVMAWFNGSSGPTVSRCGNSDTAIINIGITAGAAANYRYASANTGLTTTAPENMGAKTGTATAWWCGVE